MGNDSNEIRKGGLSGRTPWMEPAFESASGVHEAGPCRGRIISRMSIVRGCFKRKNHAHRTSPMCKDVRVFVEIPYSTEQGIIFA